MEGEHKDKIREKVKNKEKQGKTREKTAGQETVRQGKKCVMLWVDYRNARS